MATGPDSYKESYHITEWGDVIITREGNPIKKNISLDEFDPSDLFTISPTKLWDSKKTRSNSSLFQPGNTQPYNPNKTDRMLYTTQMAVNLMANRLGNLEMHESNYDVLNKMIENLLINPQIKYDTSDPETMTELTDKLKEKESAMILKEQEILRLKAQINEKETNQLKQLTDMKTIQDSMQKKLEENFAKQQNEFQEQMRKLEAKRANEASKLEQQMQFLKTNLLGKPDPDNPSPTPSSVDNLVLKEFTDQMKTQNQISIQNQLTLAPSYDGADPKQFNTWLDNVKRLAIQFGESYGNVALYTSRGTLYRFLQEQNTLKLEWKDCVPKLRETFSDCTSKAEAQERLATIKQNGKSLHGYIDNFTELLSQAHNKEPKDFGTDMLANIFIGGIDSENQHMRFKLRQFSGTTLDEYFMEALKLQKSQNLRKIDYGSKQETETLEVNAIRSNNFTCFTCGSPNHFAKDCPDQPKQQQNPSYSNPKQFNNFRSNPQSQSSNHNRQPASIEQGIDSLIKLLQSFKNNPTNQTQDKPRQGFQHNRQNTQNKQPFRNFDNKQKFKSNYHKQSTHVNEIDGFEEIEPQHDSEYDPDQEDLIDMDPSETFEKN